MTVLNIGGDNISKYYTLFLSIIFLFITGCNTSPGTQANKSEKAVSQAPSQAEVPVKAADPVAVTGISADSARTLLKGKWLRSDGTYTIEIFSVNDDGKMDAGYFNPNPINVANAVWTVSDGIILMQIVLRDVNYPGSTYSLMYNRENDVIAGTYFQAVHGISYDVVFTRNK